jgi:hypothetical protein
MKFRILVAGIVAAALSAVSAQAAVLAGQTVSVNTHAVDILSNVSDGVVVTVAAPGVASGFAGFLEAVYTDQTITVINNVPATSVTFLTADFFTLTPFSFNGLFFDVSSPVLSGLAFDPATNLAGAGAFFNGTSIWLGLAGRTFNTGDKVVLDLNGYMPPSTVPEPAAWALLLTGVGAIGSALRQRRRERTLAA